MFMGSSMFFKQDLHGMAGGLGCTHDCYHAGESPLLVRCGRLKIHPVKINNDSVCVIKDSVLVGNSSVYWDFSNGSKLQKHRVLFGPLPSQGSSLISWKTSGRITMSSMAFLSTTSMHMNQLITPN